MSQSTQFTFIMAIYGVMLILILLGLQYDSKKYAYQKTEFKNLRRKKFDEIIQLDDIYMIDSFGGGAYGCNYVAFNHSRNIIEIHNLDSTTSRISDQVIEEYIIPYEKLVDVQLFENGSICGSIAGNIDICIPDESYKKDDFYKRQKVRLMEIKFIVDEPNEFENILTLLRIEVRREMHKYERNLDIAYEILDKCAMIMENKRVRY